MDIYKSKIQYDGSIYKLKFRILVRGDLQNKEMVGDTWDPAGSMSTLKYFLAYCGNHRSILHQFYFI